jgi:hypothetical protein
VDEGEVVVINAETVADFGGAQALDQFIQQSRPGRGAEPMGRGLAAEGKFLVQRTIKFSGWLARRIHSLQVALVDETFYRLSTNLGNSGPSEKK